MEEIAEAAQIACLLEVSATKPGNVNRFYNFKDTRYEDFLLSAVALGGAFREIDKATVGETILKAVRSTRKYVKTNTNLGMILLFAPIAKAYALGRTGEWKTGGMEERESGYLVTPSPPSYSARELRTDLAKVLNSLTVEDARNAYEAIRLANPGGMGKVTDHDIREEVQVSLLEAMAAAAHRDSIAREYTSRFEITFHLGYPTLQRYFTETRDLEKSIVQTYLTLLSEIPDTLITRKQGLDVSQNVMTRAREVLQAGGIFSEVGRQKLQELDKFLRSRDNQLNPGTTADLTAAALFVIFLLNGKILQML
ncbi:MAG TPA: triphosphoribosyl-dephospho-CoA synthase [Candidatus Limnocylindrales bacterium]|nr:triphosphoribosyl-dephospho-CoA synthase [Candidatus Limnocylindrales bacterium]